MVLLFDIGNTNTHLGLANEHRLVRCADVPTQSWFNRSMERRAEKFVGGTRLLGAALCSVVPRATPLARSCVRRLWHLELLELNAKTVAGVGLRYPKPTSIGPDRLANAIAVRHRFGAPAMAVDFGTAATFDVVDARGDFIGGVIAPGWASLAECLHQQTALLPRIKVRNPRRAIGRSTEAAMLTGTVTGYRGLVREILRALKAELKCRRLPIVATGGDARFIAAALPEITAVMPDMTLEGLRLFWAQRTQ